MLVAPAAVTVTSTTPAKPDGEMALHEVVEAQLTEVPAEAPKATVLAPTTKPVPVMVTSVPPPTGPLSGEMALTLTLTLEMLKLWLAVAEAPPLF